MLSESNGKLILEHKSVNFTYQKWECLRSSISIEKAIAKPATTCHLRLVLEVVNINRKGNWEKLSLSVSFLSFALSLFLLLLYMQPFHIDRYSLPDHIETSRVWVLKNSIRVKRTTNCTYNCVAGWGPGGTCGLQQVSLAVKVLYLQIIVFLRKWQCISPSCSTVASSTSITTSSPHPPPPPPGSQLDNSKRVAVFSMWNHGNINVELVHTGPGVRVEKFRSEGTGFKSVRDVHWREEEVITFWVKGRESD